MPTSPSSHPPGSPRRAGHARWPAVSVRCWSNCGPVTRGSVPGPAPPMACCRRSTLTSTMRASCAELTGLNATASRPSPTATATWIARPADPDARPATRNRISHWPACRPSGRQSGQGFFLAFWGPTGGLRAGCVGGGYLVMPSKSRWSSRRSCGMVVSWRCATVQVPSEMSAFRAFVVTQRNPINSPYVRTAASPEH